MLKRLFRLLNRDLTGKTWEVEASHPYFGDIVYFGSRDSDKGYWECELEVDGEPLFVGINSASQELPNDEHVLFVQDILANPAQTFDLVAPFLIPTYKEVTGSDLPESWQDVLKLESLFVPQDCNRDNAWELSYGGNTENDDHQFTCHFFPDKPSSISITH